MRLLLLPFFLAALEDANEAETIFRAMVKKLADAKTVQISEQGVLESDRVVAKTKGTIMLAQGNKARVRIEVEYPKAGTSVDLIVSDGSKLWAETSNPLGDKKEDRTTAPKHLNALILGATARMGIFPGANAARPVKPDFKWPAIERLFHVSDFVMGKKGKIGNREVQEIAYKLRVDKQEPFHSVSLWLDAESKLPVKRTLTISDAKVTVRFTQDYQVDLNVKIDAQQFVVPKRKQPD
jgi:outer membrane lipoprotein-sorting protein